MAELAHEAMCSRQPWVGLRDLFSKNTVWWPVRMFPVPESWSQQARKQGLPDKVSFLPSYLCDPF